MIFNVNVWTIEEVQELLDKAKADLLDGKSITSWNSLGTSATMTTVLSPIRMIEECTKFLQAVDPATYGSRMKTGQILHGY